MWDQSAKAEQPNDSLQNHLPAEPPQEETQNPTRASVAPFNTPDYRFECICGELGLIDYKARVQCMNCQLWQHANCVNYKEESLQTTPFYCPHCLVSMKPVSTGATLIISPSSICHQWVEEINRHIRSSSLRVLVRAVPLHSSGSNSKVCWSPVEQHQNYMYRETITKTNIIISGFYVLLFTL